MIQNQLAMKLTLNPQVIEATNENSSNTASVSEVETPTPPVRSAQTKHQIQALLPESLGGKMVSNYPEIRP